MKRNSLFLFFAKIFILAIAVASSSAAGFCAQTCQAGTELHNIEAQAVQAGAGIYDTKFRTFEVSSGVMPSRKIVRYVKKGVYLGKRNIGGMSEIKLAELLKNIELKTNAVVKDAVFDEKTWTIYREKPGVRLDKNDTLNKALTARPGTRVKYSFIITKPNVTSATIGKDVSVISKFTTPILDRSKSRVNNIRLVSSKINGKIIMPGEEFSFNKLTGRKTRENGYQDATVIVRTPKGPEHKKAPGGGVCQVSTTIYNAVLQCGLKVTERHEHSDDVYYVPRGKDATVSYNWADFRFVNNREYPVMLKIFIGKRTVQVRLIENRRNG